MIYDRLGNPIVIGSVVMNTNYSVVRVVLRRGDWSGGVIFGTVVLESFSTIAVPGETCFPISGELGDRIRGLEVIGRVHGIR